ncbi:uncharacterized protein LOC116221853 isoform X1 [Clupea harengus]|uniref:Uncharacterized protein LOC116221853 isoform X1 n=1 Tax=Clupea harengus TaxID=7950 RepID=A0A6P8G1W8_CLUHA|nr:uncharacterized protein LOC116221853 isoform X1 [Clupea harengus]
MVRACQRKKARGRPVRDAMRKAVKHVVSHMKATTKDLSVNDHTLTHVCDQISENEIDAMEDTPACNEGNVDARRESSSDLERELASCIFSAADIYICLSSEKVRRLAYQFAVKHQQPVPLLWKKDELASEDWLSAFLRQHPTLPISSAKATGPTGGTGFNKNNVHVFLSNLEDVVKRHGFRPELMWYAEEIGVAIAQNRHTVGTRRDFQQVAAITSAEQSCPLTMTCSVSATGNTIPLYSVFPRLRFMEDVHAGAPAGSCGGSHPNGWLKEEQFLDFLRHFVRHSKCSPERPCLLLTDNHGSYLSIEALDFARGNGIMWRMIPPNCFHLLQPLECTVYRPIKAHINTAIDDWLLASPGKTVAIHDIPGIITRVLPLVTSPHNIMAGFKACGIYPLNPDIFTDSSATDHPISSETHPYSEPALICNGGACNPDNKNHTRIPVAYDGQGHSSSTHDLQDYHRTPGLWFHSPTPGPSGAPSGPTSGCIDSPESSDEDEGLCRVCMEPFPHSNSEVVCLQCVLRRKWTQSDDLDHSIIASVTQPKNALEPAHTTEVAAHDIHKDAHDLQKDTYSDSSPTHNLHNHILSTSEPAQDVENNHTHSASTSTNGTPNHTHHTTAPTHNTENHSHVDLAPTHNAHDHTHMDFNIEEHTHGTLAPEHLQSAPGVPECPHSPTPGPSTAPSGQTPGRLHSAESSDEDKSFCQVCMEPFPHSNLEVVCLQCVLRRSWMQSDDTDCSIVPSGTASPSILEIDNDVDDATSSASLSIHNVRNHSNSITGHPIILTVCHSPRDPEQNNEDATHDVQTPSHDIQSPSHDIQSHTHDVQTPSHDVQSHTHDVQTPSHDIQSHTHDVQTPSHDVQSHTHDVQTPSHDVQSHTHDIQTPSHDIQSHTHDVQTPSHDVQTPSHDIQSHTHDVQTPSHDIQSHTHDVQTPSHDVQSHTHDVQTPSHDIQSHTHDVQTPSHDVQSHTHDIQTPSSEVQNQTNRLLVSTHDVQIHPDSTSVLTHDVQNHTQGYPIILSVWHSPCHPEHNNEDASADVQSHTQGYPIILSVWHAPSDPEHNNADTSHDVQNPTQCASVLNHDTYYQTHSESASTQIHTSSNSVSAVTEQDQTHSASVQNTQASTCQTPEPELLHSVLGLSERPLSPTTPGPSTAHGCQTPSHHTAVRTGTPPGLPDCLHTLSFSVWPQGLTSGPSTAPGGRMPGRLDSPESSDEDEGVCQGCMEPFPHSNSEVLCLHCVLRMKWGQSGSGYAEQMS